MLDTVIFRLIDKFKKDETYSIETVEALAIAVEKEKVAEIVDCLYPSYVLPEGYQEGMPTPWLPNDSIDYVLILHSYLRWDDRLRDDWCVFYSYHLQAKKVSRLHPHDLNMLAREWLAEHNYHKLNETNL